MSALDVITSHDFFSQSSFISDILRIIGWAVVKILRMLSSAMEAVMNACFEFLSFTESEVIAGYLSEFRVLIGIAITVSLMLLGATYMFSEKRPPVLKNIIIGILVLYGLPTVTTALNEVVYLFKDYTVANESFTTTVMKENITDLLYVDRKDWSIESGFRNDLKATNFDYMDINEVVTKNSSGITSLGSDVFNTRVYIDESGKVTTEGFGKKGWLDLFPPPYYYRFYVSFFTLMIMLIINIFLMFTAGYKVIVITKELIFVQLASIIFSGDVFSGQKIKKCLETFFTCYMSLIFVLITLKVYYLAVQYVNISVSSSLIRLILTMILAATTVSGSNFVEKNLGFDASLSEGGNKVMGGVQSTIMTMQFLSFLKNKNSGGGSGQGSEQDASGGATKKSGLKNAFSSAFSGGNATKDPGQPGATNKSAADNHVPQPGDDSKGFSADASENKDKMGSPSGIPGVHAFSGKPDQPDIHQSGEHGAETDPKKGETGESHHKNSQMSGGSEQNGPANEPHDSHAQEQRTSSTDQKNSQDQKPMQEKPMQEQPMQEQPSMSGAAHQSDHQSQSQTASIHAKEDDHSHKESKQGDHASDQDPMNSIATNKGAEQSDGESKHPAGHTNDPNDIMNRKYSTTSAAVDTPSSPTSTGTSTDIGTSTDDQTKEKSSSATANETMQSTPAANEEGSTNTSRNRYSTTSAASSQQGTSDQVSNPQSIQGQGSATSSTSPTSTSTTNSGTRADATLHSGTSDHVQNPNSGSVPNTGTSRESGDVKSNEHREAAVHSGTSDHVQNPDSGSVPNTGTSRESGDVKSNEHREAAVHSSTPDHVQNPNSGSVPNTGRESGEVKSNEHREAAGHHDINHVGTLHSGTSIHESAPELNEPTEPTQPNIPGEE